MESLNSNMKAVLITPFVSSLEFGWMAGGRGERWDTDVTVYNRLHKGFWVIKAAVYLEIQQCIQLVLNDGQSLNELLCVHGAHHTIGPKNHTIMHMQNSSSL